MNLARWLTTPTTAAARLTGYAAQNSVTGADARASPGWARLVQAGSPEVGQCRARAPLSYSREGH